MDTGQSRRLSAVLMADIAGYTALVEHDSDGTVVAWKAVRAEVINPNVAAFEGKIVKYTGDGFLAEFASVQSALECALAMQHGFAASPLNFRIGISLGDVIDDGLDIHGEGVNIAARIESLAEPGEICVTALVRDSVRNRVAVDFDDLGTHQLKHVSEPVLVYRVLQQDMSVVPVDMKVIDEVRPEVSNRDEHAAPGAAVQKGMVRPSIAALAFENRSGDPEQEYFCDGLVEDVIVALSRFKDLRVIACSSSFRYKGQTLDLALIGQELGARYVLTGSVRKAGKRIRLTAQLVATDSLESIWSERFDTELDDVFEVQDRLTHAIAAQIFPSITKAQLQQNSRKRPTDLNAWDLSLKAQQAASSGTAESFREARAYAAQALAIDPECMQALACTAWCYISEAWMNFAADREQSVALGIAAARKALAIDENDSYAVTCLGYGLFFAGQRQQGLSHLRSAVELNRNAAFSWQIYGLLLMSSGAADAALNALQQAALLSPHDPNRHLWLNCMGVAAFDRGCYEQAIGYHREAIAISPEFPAAYRGLAANLSASGRLEEARAVVLQMQTLQPNWTAVQSGGGIPFFADARLRERYKAALVAAGMSLS